MQAIEVFFLFLRMGCIAFGGPLAHTALFEEEFVRKRNWLNHEHFLEAMSLTQLIPGPNSTELAMQIGYYRAGWLGYFLAGLGFILPAALMVFVIAALYSNGEFTELFARLWGLKPVVAAIIVTALYRLGKKSFPSKKGVFCALVGFSLSFFGAQDFTALCFTAGLIFLTGRKFLFALPAFFLACTPWLPIFPSIESISIFSLFKQMLLLGSMVFGSGFVLFSFFQQRFVEQLHWLNSETVAMAITAGQLTPGPLFTSATFIGQVLGGPAGALAATIGIFSPAFLFGALSVVLVKKIRHSVLWKDTLAALIPLCFFFLFRETWRLFPTLVPGTMGWIIFGFALLLTWRRVSSPWILILGGCTGAFFSH